MRPSPSANAPTSVCLLDRYEISAEDLAAYKANPPRHRYRNTKAPSTPALEDRWLLEGRTWPNWTPAQSSPTSLLEE